MSGAQATGGAGVSGPVLSADVRAELSRAVLAREPFRAGRRRDGTPLANYFDGHRLLVDPALLAPIAGHLCRAIQATAATHVAGEVSAGSALAVAVSLASRHTGRTLFAHGLRREPKAYGVVGRFTTPAPPGVPFALVDDVAGTGDTTVRSVRALREAGHPVLGVFVVLDRQQGAAEALAVEGLALTSLFRIPDLTPVGEGPRHAVRGHRDEVAAP